MLGKRKPTERSPWAFVGLVFSYLSLRLDDYRALAFDQHLKDLLDI